MGLYNGFGSAFLIMTKQCNLACTYCYEKSKCVGEHMSLEVAKQSVDWLYKSTIERESEKKVQVTFFGGEPTLRREVILEVMDYAMEKERETGIPVEFDIITNGLIYFPEWFDKITEYGKEPRMQFSVDGTPECQDMDRLLTNGEGSSQVVFKNLDMYIRKIEEMGLKLGKNFHVHPCISRKTLPYLHENFMYFIKKGFKDFWAMPVHGEKWSTEDMKMYEDQLRLIMNYVSENPSVNYATFKCFSEGPESTCSAGRGLCGIDVDGSIHICHHYTFDKRDKQLGDIWNGVTEEKISQEVGDRGDRKLMKGVIECKDCGYKTCYQCFAEYEIAGDKWNCVPESYCRMAKIEHKIILELEEKIRCEKILYELNEELCSYNVLLQEASAALKEAGLENFMDEVEVVATEQKRLIEVSREMLERAIERIENLN